MSPKSRRAAPKLGRILFVASREPEYSRVKIVSAALSRSFEVDRIVCSRNTYGRRLTEVLVRYALRRKRHRYDAVVAGFFAQPILPLVRSLWRGPLVSDLFFSFYDTWIEDKRRFGDGTLAASIARRLDRYALRRSDLVLVDTASHGEYFVEAFGPTSAPVRRLWVSADPEEFPRLEPLSYDPAKPFEILFFGGYIPLQGVEVIVAAAARLPPERFRFTLVGGGQTRPACERLAAELALPHLEFADFEETSALVERARRSHLLLGVFGDTAKARRVIPNKAYDALALGRPLLTGASPAVAELLVDGEDVMLCPMADAEALAAKIRWARDHHETAVAIGERGHTTFERRASPAVVADILRREVGSLLSGRIRR